MDNYFVILKKKSKTSFTNESGQSMHRVLHDTAEKWEVHVSLTNEIAKHPKEIV